MASPTVAIVSALSSGIEMLNSFSNSIISSTVSRESAPRSFCEACFGLYFSLVNTKFLYNDSFYFRFNF